jgi:hypothetical protein
MTATTTTTQQPARVKVEPMPFFMGWQTLIFMSDGHTYKAGS